MKNIYVKNSCPIENEYIFLWCFFKLSVTLCLSLTLSDQDLSGFKFLITITIRQSNGNQLEDGLTLINRCVWAKISSK